MVEREEQTRSEVSLGSKAVQKEEQGRGVWTAEAEKAQKEERLIYMISLADVNKLILSDFSDRWEFCPIIWDMHNSHADIDKVLKTSAVKLVASPIVEFLMVEPLEIPVTMAMRRVILTLNLVTAEPEGTGNKSTLESVDAFLRPILQMVLG